MGVMTTDLSVTIKSSKTVFPAKLPTSRRSMFLSNIHLALTFDVETVHFFDQNPEFPPERVYKILEQALGELLVVYDFEAGRFRFNEEEKRLEIDCNLAGVQFIDAASELPLSEIGDLDFLNPGFRQLVARPPDSMALEDRPLLFMQVTSFRRGGFAMGIYVTHVLHDGNGAKIFFQNLASLSAGKGLEIAPFTDRSVLRARSLPLVKFPHLELIKLENPSDLLEETLKSVNEDDPVLETRDFVLRTFKLSANQVSKLKDKAKEEGACSMSITSFNVVIAHLWRSKVLSTDTPPDKRWMVLYTIDIRSRIKPPFLPEYAGNAVLATYATATTEEVKEKPFSFCVEKVWEGTNRMTDEYAKSAIDYGETYTGLPHGDIFVSSWWKLGIADVDYPWGKPKYVCPLVEMDKDLTLFLPCKDDKPARDDNTTEQNEKIRNGSHGRGIKVLLKVSNKEYESFKEQFTCKY